MTIQEKLALLEETLEADVGTLKPEMSLADVAEYDSMSKLSIIVMMEDNFDKKLKAEDVRAFQTVNDILKMMEK